MFILSYFVFLKAFFLIQFTLVWIKSYLDLV